MSLTTSTTNGSTGSSIDSRRSHRSKTRSPSLEELIEEAEKESEGPNYRYPLPSSSDSDTSSVGYHSVNRMSSSSLSSPTSNNSATYNFTRVPKLSPNHGTHSPSPLLKSPYSDFILKPRVTKTVSQSSENEKKDEDYVCLRPSSEIHVPRKTQGRVQLNSVPILSDDVLSHTYEYLPPLPLKEKEKKDDAFDSYIEMAPRTDLRPMSTPSNLPKSPLKFSPVHKGKKENIIYKITKCFIIFFILFVS